MPRITYGSSGGDFAAEVEKARALTATLEQVDAKEREYQASQEASQATEAGSVRTRSGLTQATEALSQALRGNISSLAEETAALRSNSVELERQLALRRELAATGGGGGGRGIVPPVAYAAGGPGEDPERRAQIDAQAARVAAVRYETTARQLAAAEQFIARPGPIALGPGGSTGPSIAPLTPILSPAQRAAHDVSGMTGTDAEINKAKQEAQSYYESVAKNEQAIGRMGQAQAGANSEFQAAAAAYASSSGALSRHGALTTEFIQALARGQVTLGEFGSQMVSTIGKFGGWIAAGAAVYGVVKLFGDLTKGATETQAAVEQMGRFIPGLGGPAGGGSGQIPVFEGQLRDISTQFNVPISEVTTSMMVMSRTFHTVTDAANATRAALAIQRLDLVPPAQTEQYLTGIANSLGFSGRPGGGAQLIGVVNQLNELQSQYGARVAQVLPGLARAAPAAIASGTNLNQLEALTALGVRAGLPGNQVGTALLRSMTTFAFRPQSELTFSRFGIQPVAGEYGNLVEQLFSQVASRARSGHPYSNTDLTQLAQALGGPQLGGRSILPLLVQQSAHPQEGGLFQQMLDATHHPRSYQEDLDQVLNTIGERFKSIGIALQNFGSQLAESGALQPLVTLLSVFKDLASAVESTISPFTRVLGLFNVLPGFMQQIAGAAAVFAAARWVSTSTRFGGAATAAISRLPGLGGLYSEPRAEVEGALGRFQTYLLPTQESDLDSARLRRLRAASAYEQSVAQFNQYAGASAGARSGDLGADAQREADARLIGLREAQESKLQALGKAQDEEGQAQRALAQTQADIEVLKTKQLSWAERATYLEQRGAVASEEIVGLKQQLVEQALAQLRGGSVAVGAAGLAGLTPAAAVATARAASDPGGELAAAGAAAATAATAAAVRGFKSVSDRPSAIGPFIAGTEGPATLASDLGVAGEASMAARLRSGITARLQSVRDTAVGLAGGPALPLAGALISQSIPGYTGQALQSGFSDALLASFIPGAGAALRIGAFGLGVGTTPRTSGGPAQQALQTAGYAAAGGFVASKAAPLVARGLGSLIEAASPELSTLLDVGAPEIGIPLTILGALGGGALGNLFGGSNPPPPPQPSAWGVNGDAMSALHSALYGGRAGQQAFGSNVQGLLQDAYLGTGSQSQRGQQSAAAIVQTLTAQLGLFGTGSPEGQAAQGAISTFLGAAAPLARYNPQVTQQIMQTLTQATNAEVQRRFQAALAQGGPGAGASAASAAIAQTQAGTVVPLETAGTDAQSVLADRQTVLAQMQARANAASGQQRQALEKQVAAQHTYVAEAQANVQTLTALTSLARDNASLQSQQYAQQALQADQQSQQAQTQLAVAQAGGSTIGQLRASLAGAQKSLALVQNAPGLSPRQRADALAQAQAAVINTHNQITQQGLAALQASGAVAEASTPIGDQAAAAAQKARDAYQQWHYMVNNRRAFDPNQIKQAWANVLAARRDAIQAAADQATQLNDLRAQLAQAQDYGDPVGQASIAIGQYQRDLSLAVTPQARAQAAVNLANAYNQRHQAYMAQIAAEGQLAASQHPGDDVGAALATVRSAQLALANARGIQEITQAQTDLNNANSAYYQALVQQADSAYQTAEVNATGNIVLQARIAQAQAAYDTRAARGPTEAAKAAQESAQASVQAHQAEMQRHAEEASLAEARAWGNPVGQARRAEAAARFVIRNARGPDERIAGEVQLAQAEQQMAQARETIIGARGSVREARHAGDAVASARIAVQTARQELEAARGEQQRMQAEAQLATAEHALSEARIARMQALAQIESTTDTGNVIAQAEDAIRAAAREMELAKGRDAHIKARQDEATARQQMIAAEQQRAQEYGQLAEANAGGDPVATARAALAAAARQLELAHGLDQQLAAETAMANAQTQLHQALEQQIIAMGQLAASTTRDPLQQLQDQMSATASALASARTPSERVQYQTQLNNLKNQYTATLIQQTEDTINFQLQMKQITAQQAIAQLRSLESTQKLTIQERQQIEEQIRQLQLGGGTSEFNLAPGSIKLPTIYDVARAIGAGGPAASPFGTGSVSATANSTIQVFVGNDADVAKVAAAIDNATGSQLAGALRAAGLSS